MIDSEQEIIAFLSDSDAYGEPGAFVSRIETHCSIAFLVQDRAFKLKRPVAFSSLDYSTVEKRGAACRAELALNRRTAPELYLGTHTVNRRASGELGFDGDGEILDWIVEMRRFDQADLLDHVADATRLNPDLMASLADEIADFHRRAEPVSGYGGAAGLQAAIEHNQADLKTVGAIVDGEAVESLLQASFDALGRVSDILDHRRDQGQVRRCHGDLRLANICLLDGRPTLFDAIEFCENISCIDVLFDVAFLLADLHLRRLDLEANILVNRYVDLAADSDGLAVLPLMISIRLATRAYSVAAASLRQASAESARHLAASARSTLALAMALLIRRPPRLLAIGGLQGSLKTAFAHGAASSLGPSPGARILHSETVRRRMLRVGRDSRLSHQAYDKKTAQRVLSALAAETRMLLAAGLSVGVDADFYQPEDREAIAAIASALSVPFTGLWLAEPEEMKASAAPEMAGWQTIERQSSLSEACKTGQTIAGSIRNG